MNRRWLGTSARMPTSKTMPLGDAIGIDAAVAYGVAMLTVMLLPETRGRELLPAASAESQSGSGVGAHARRVA